MEPRELLDALAVADRLKDTTRHCYTVGGRHESVAEHSWRANRLRGIFLPSVKRRRMRRPKKNCCITG